MSPLLFRFFIVDTGTRAYADDLLQECWLRVHKSRHTYRLGEPVLPWMFAIARHTRTDGFERRRRIESHEVAVALLRRLRENAGNCLSRQFLLRNIWGYQDGVRSRTLGVHIRRLRAKLGPAWGTNIKTFFGDGYCWYPER